MIDTSLIDTNLHIRNRNANFQNQTRLMLAIFIVGVATSLTYDQVVSTHLSYLSLLAVAVTCFFIPFMLIGGVVSSIAIAALIARAWVFTIFLTVFTLIWNSVLYMFFNIPMIGSGVESNTLRMFLLITWLIGFGAPFVFYNSFKELSEKHLSQTQKEEEDKSVWSRHDHKNIATIIQILLVVSLFLCGAFLLIIIQTNRGAVYLPLISVSLGITLSLRLTYFKAQRYQPLELTIPEHEQVLKMRGSFLGECTINAEEIAHIQVRTWETTHRTKNGTKTSHHTTLELLLWDGAIQRLVYSSVLAQREKMRSDAQKISKHFGLELLERRNTTSQWNPNQHPSIQESPTSDDEYPLEGFTDPAMSHEYSSHALHIQEGLGRLKVTYAPPLTPAGLSQLKWSPCVYSLIWSGVAGLLSVLGVHLLPTLSYQAIAVIAMTVICFRVAHQHVSTRVSSLSSTTVITLEDDALSFAISDHSTPQTQHTTFAASEVAYARVEIDLDQRSASLSVGTQEENITLIRIEEGWFEGQVEDLQHIEKLIEQKYGVV